MKREKTVRISKKISNQEINNINMLKRIILDNGIRVVLERYLMSDQYQLVFG